MAGLYAARAHKTMLMQCLPRTNEEDVSTGLCDSIVFYFSSFNVCCRIFAIFTSFFFKFVCEYFMRWFWFVFEVISVLVCDDNDLWPNNRHKISCVFLYLAVFWWATLGFAQAQEAHNGKLEEARPISCANAVMANNRNTHTQTNSRHILLCLIRKSTIESS